MQPIKTNILCKPFPSDEVSESGIIVPESYRKPSNKMLVVEVGNGTKEKPMKLKEGDIGFRVKDHGTEVLINGELHFLMDQSVIIATQEN